MATFNSYSPLDKFDYNTVEAHGGADEAMGALMAVVDEQGQVVMLL